MVKTSGPPAPGEPLTRDQREQIAFQLLEGGPHASALPLRDVDDGKAFDPRLLEKVTPTVKSALVKFGRVSVAGRLPPEVIQRILRQLRTPIIACYQVGLRKKPDLSGTVSVSFVIDTGGSVSQAVDAGSTLSDRNVCACGAQSVGRVSFPAPEGGVVKVVAPFELTPPG